MSNRPFTYGFAPLLVFLGVAALSIFTGFRGLQQWGLWYWLHQNGSVAEGRAINLRTNPEGNLFYVEYAFSAETERGQPQQFEREELVSASFYRSLERGTVVAVRYDPVNPLVSRIASNQYPYLIDIIISLVCIFLGVIPAIALHRLANYRFEPLKLFRHRLRF